MLNTSQRNAALEVHQEMLYSGYEVQVWRLWKQSASTWILTEMSFSRGMETDSWSSLGSRSRVRLIPSNRLWNRPLPGTD